ncbi:MAG: CpsD/CapB family tyrosine-protein kinase [Chloroflexi bacterium]|nr:CpsD/CapB family tyrosine-protein kinase [Chloroflexota bacterium]
MSSNSMPALVTINDPRSPVAEAYRSLRTNIEFSGLDQKLHSLVVTSAAPDEGKSTTLANLAVVMAQAGRKIILVDCDLRRPTLHEIFGAPNDAGLTTMMLQEELLQRPPFQTTAVKDLLLLPSGPLPPNPAEILGSRRMSEVIEALVQASDMVLFDAPPVIAVTDAAVLAARVDGVLLVISAGQTRREHALKARDLLQRVNARLIGTVLNNANPDSLMQYYG